MNQRINLTEIQRKMLLEMCNYLFPDIKHIYYDKYDGSQQSLLAGHIHVFEKGVIEGISGYYYNPDLTIHWFEFVVKHLIVELYNRISENNLLIRIDLTFAFHEACLIVDRNPIDYLYEQFTKYKQQ